MKFLQFKNKYTRIQKLYHHEIICSSYMSHNVRGAVKKYAAFTQKCPERDIIKSCWKHC